ncbi:Beta-amyrin 28-oxidase [Vitis vinifera]|uniref:Beta-amyrin 28-oxidase n=1 Tax=Vitis vinifera TaxID=29760 RepID=A0A438GEX1_VITVI|nr:Beta-amyrin 28-oxidase [Vitis vinifera]
MAVMCGASGNKFLFSNEDKLVTSWWPNLIKKILYFPSLLNDASTRDLTKPHRALLQFLKQYVEIMDLMAHKHIDMDWAPNKKVKVYLLSKKYTFALSCRLFLKIEDSEWVARISNDFDHIMAGFISLPIDIPDENGKVLNEMEISTYILGVLLASHEPQALLSHLSSSIFQSFQMSMMQS